MTSQALCRQHQVEFLQHGKVKTRFEYAATALGAMSDRSDAELDLRYFIVDAVEMTPDAIRKLEQSLRGGMVTVVFVVTQDSAFTWPAGPSKELLYCTVAAKRFSGIRMLFNGLLEGLFSSGNGAVDWPMLAQILKGPANAHLVSAEADSDAALMLTLQKELSALALPASAAHAAFSHFDYCEEHGMVMKPLW